MFDLVDFVFAFFLAAVPVQHHAHREPTATTLARYESISEDIARVALDPATTPLFDGADGRARTAILLASIAASESFLRADVDACKAKGDGGKSATVFQLQGAHKAVCADREEAARVALERVRASLEMCRRSPAPDRLALYTSGSCARGQRASRYRWQRAETWMRTHPVIDPEETERY